MLLNEVLGYRLWIVVRHCPLVRYSGYTIGRSILTSRAAIYASHQELFREYVLVHQVRGALRSPPSGQRRNDVAVLCLVERLERGRPYVSKGANREGELCRRRIVRQFKDGHEVVSPQG